MASEAAAGGWLVLDKPAGMTSASAVARLRRLLGIRKAGHAGTLDPFATGVLPIAFGEATKTVPYVAGWRKSYRFTVAWGEARDTDDITGTTVAEGGALPDRASIEAALEAFRGDILQRPPRFSAVHAGGRRAYRRARAGEDFELAPRPARVEALRLLGREGPGRARLEMECGKGVYVRSLARDLGEALGCLGYATELRRTAVGPFSAPVPLDAIEELMHTGARRAMLLPISAGLDDIPALEVTGEEARLLRRGMVIRCPAPGAPQGAAVWASEGGEVVAICELREALLRPSRVFHPRQEG